MSITDEDASRCLRSDRCGVLVTVADENIGARVGCHRVLRWFVRAVFYRSGYRTSFGLFGSGRGWITSPLDGFGSTLRVVVRRRHG